MVKKIVAGDYFKGYVLDKEAGEWTPPQFKVRLRSISGCNRQ